MINILKGLFLKDLLNLNKSIKSLIFTLIFICCFGFIGKGFMFYVSMMPIMTIGMMSLGTFGYDDLSKADSFILSFPITRRIIVKARYIFIILLTTIATLLSITAATIIGFIITKEIPDLMTIVFNSTISFLIITILECFQIPCFYKWGAERGRFTSIIILAIMAAIGTFGYMILSEINIDINWENIFLISDSVKILLILAINAIFYYTSYRVSYRIYNKKEF